MTENQSGKLKVIPGGKEKCPNCGGCNSIHNYGMAAGGIGSYDMCLDCDGPYFNVVQDEVDDE